MLTPEIILFINTLYCFLIFYFSILLNRWQFFNQSQVRLGHSPGASDTLMREDVLQNSEQLIEILQAFGNALLQSDINIFKLSLTCLENLNVRWKLYHNVNKFSYPIKINFAKKINLFFCF